MTRPAHYAVCGELMTADQLSNLNMWMAILAVASVVEIAALAALTIFGYRLYAHSRRTIDELEHRHIEPLTRRVNDVLDTVSTEVARIRHAGDRVQQTVQAVNGGLSHAASVVTATVMPGWAVTKGVLAAASAFRAAGKTARLKRPAPKDRDLDRFVNEGGNDA